MVVSWSKKLDTVGVIAQVLSEENVMRSRESSIEGRESDDDERFSDLAKDNGRVPGYDGTWGITDVLSGLPK